MSHKQKNYTGPWQKLKNLHLKIGHNEVPLLADTDNKPST